MSNMLTREEDAQVVGTVLDAANALVYLHFKDFLRKGVWNVPIKNLKQKMHTNKYNLMK